MSADKEQSVEERLHDVVRILRECASEHFFRYELNSMASDLEDIMERERERLGEWS